MKKVMIALLLFCILVACTDDKLSNPLDSRLRDALRRLSPDGSIEHYVLPQADDYDAIPSGRKNPITAEKVALGRLLFFETGLARHARQEDGMGSYSCSSCHLPTAGFMPGREQGIADGGKGFGLNGELRTRKENYREDEMDVQGARALSLLNVAYVTNTTWTGKFGAYHQNLGTEHLWGVDDPSTEVNKLGLDGLEAQNIEGLELHRMEVDDYVLDTLGYRDWYDRAFADWPTAERYGDLSTSFAISAYLRTLLTTEAPFQRFLRGETDAMSEVEKRGAILFYGKAGCYRCHTGPALNANAFYALGVNDLYQSGNTFNTAPDNLRNFGRGGFTGKAADLYKFKVPGIYNMADAPFYFHGSSKRSLGEVIAYFNAGQAENERVPIDNLAPQFHPLHLTDQEMQELEAFLSEGLRDPDLQRYVPEEVLSGNCFPNNDPESRQALGCD